MTSKEWYSRGAYFTYNQFKTFYRREGKGPVLLCIHGFPSSSWDFGSIWSELTQKFDVIAIDLIGLGKSSKPKQPLTVNLQADQIERLLTTLQIESVHLLTHDLGDTVAQELLARHMDRSAKVNWLSCIFLNGGIFPETHQPLLIQKLLISPMGKFLSPFMSEKTLKKNMTNIFSKEHPPSNQFIKGTWQLICHGNGKTMIPRLIRYMKERSTFRERWVNPLERNMIPLRLINGIQDPISGGHAADRFAEVVPNADIVRLKNAGHYPHIETPMEVMEAFIAFHDTLDSA